MKLHELKPAEGSRGRKKRIGRGEGSGHGGTSTRGHKGAQARSGYSRKIGFEGGQMPIQRRLPKFGFTNPNRVEYVAINVADLQKIADKLGVNSIDVELLKANGIVAKTALVKILGNGELTAKLEVSADALTIRNIFKIEELRKRIVYTILLLLVYRLGSFIVLPGIDSAQLANLQDNTQEGLVGLLNMFSGGAFGNASIFALGVMPYISASIVIQLLGVFVPYFRKLQMEGESGRRKMNQMTRYLTILILCIQGPAYMAALHNQIPESAFLAVHNLGWSNFMFNFVSTIILIGGTMFVMWLGERITDRGIGNGISLIIMVGIIARLPYALTAEIGEKVNNTAGGVLLLIVELVILFFVFVAAIALVQGVRKVPVQYAKRIVGNKQYGGVRQYIPMKINAAGVMPIIFAQALMLFPLIFSQFDATRGLAATLSNYTGFWYNLIFGLLVVIFTYFYTAVTVNPTMMAEQLKQNGGFIPGVKPGKKTVEYLDSIMSRVTLPGSIFLALIAILPAFAMLLGVNNQFASFYGGTSLLILVGVVLDTLQQIESHLLMRHYDGLMKTGRLKGRSGM